MNLTVLASGSTGNGYLLTNGKETLIMEMGVTLSKVKQALSFDLSGIAGAICSHVHLDHSKYLKDYAMAGIDCLALQDVFESKKNLGASNRCKPVLPGKGYKLGNFKIVPFEAAHDVPCIGFLINHPDCGNVLFMTDSFMSEHTFKNLNHLLIEVNFADDILEKNIMNGSLHPSMRPRLLNTHMELSTCLDLLKANDLSNVRNIVLCHLSNGNSDEDRFIREVRETTGKQVFAASPGLIVDFSKEPY